MSNVVRLHQIVDWIYWTERNYRKWKMDEDAAPMCNVYVQRVLHSCATPTGRRNKQEQKICSYFHCPFSLWRIPTVIVASLSIAASTFIISSLFVASTRRYEIPVNLTPFKRTHLYSLKHWTTTSTYIQNQSRFSHSPVHFALPRCVRISYLLKYKIHSFGISFVHSIVLNSNCGTVLCIVHRAHGTHSHIPTQLLHFESALNSYVFLTVVWVTPHVSVCVRISLYSQLNNATIYTGVSKSEGTDHHHHV